MAKDFYEISAPDPATSHFTIKALASDDEIPADVRELKARLEVFLETLARAPAPPDAKIYDELHALALALNGEGDIGEAMKRLEGIAVPGPAVQARAKPAAPVNAVISSAAARE